MVRNDRMTTPRRLIALVAGLVMMPGMVGCAGMSAGMAGGPVSRSIAAARDAGLYAPQPLDGIGRAGGLFGGGRDASPPRGRTELAARTTGRTRSSLNGSDGSPSRDSELVHVSRRPGGQASRYFPGMERDDANLSDPDAEKVALERRLAKLEAELRRVRIFGTKALVNESPLTASHSKRDEGGPPPAAQPQRHQVNDEPDELPIALALKLPQSRRDDLRRASVEQVRDRDANR